MPDLILGSAQLDTGFLPVWVNASKPGLYRFWVNSEFWAWERALKYQLQPIWTGFGEELGGFRVQTRYSVRIRRRGRFLPKIGSCRVESWFLASF
jgi:hypothetical protein